MVLEKVNISQNKCQSLMNEGMSIVANIFFFFVGEYLYFSQIILNHTAVCGWQCAIFSFLENKILFPAIRFGCVCRNFRSVFVPDGRRQCEKLFFGLPTVGGSAKNYFLVSRRSAAVQKIIFWSPDGWRQCKKLFFGLPTAGGNAKNYFLVSRQSAAIFQIFYHLYLYASDKNYIVMKKEN
jgi:hypothetical protein